MTPDTIAAQTRGEHSTRCYWDFTECRWVCRPGAEASAHPGPCTASQSLAMPPAAPLAVPAAAPR